MAAEGFHRDSIPGAPMFSQAFLSRSASTLRRCAAHTRPGQVLALSAAAAAALGLAGLRDVDLPGPRPVKNGERMTIEVVHPVEPEIIAGSRMEVGELVDGFQGVPPPLPNVTDVGWTYDEGGESFDAYQTRRPDERRPTEVRTEVPDPPPERSPARIVQRWFGFDAPRRDFEGERAARRARLEAMELAARERQDRLRRQYEQAEQARYVAERRRAGARPLAWEEGGRPREWREPGRRGEMWRDAGPRPYEPAGSAYSDGGDWSG